jgi:N-acetylglucosaminyldiphosphoundecaprenol N-acetyl-beta-D-mannosaminyltransferase
MSDPQAINGQRQVVPVLGLPFDVVTLEQAVERVTEAIRSRTRLFLSTPNLNFAISARTDRALRQSVLCSDLSVVDGMPLVWASRLAGCSLPERVSGSDLFARLSSRSAATPINVYFFGGESGAAEAACTALNERRAGARCVGFASPGFGSVEDMSAPAYIDAINAADADLLVVAVSARKGQAWIMRNLDRIRTPVVAYLGAVINFESGRVRRAPVWMSRMGLEWLWRISQEPALWRRYAADALALLRLLVGQVLPMALRRLALGKNHHSAPSGSVTTRRRGDALVVAVSGKVDAALSSQIMQALDFGMQESSLVLDLAQVTWIDPCGIACCMVSQGMAVRRGRGLTVEHVPEVVRMQFARHGADYLLVN